MTILLKHRACDRCGAQLQARPRSPPLGRPPIAMPIAAPHWADSPLVWFGSVPDFSNSHVCFSCSFLRCGCARGSLAARQPASLPASQPASQGLVAFTLNPDAQEGFSPQDAGEMADSTD